jgi:hypothetical protein
MTRASWDRLLGPAPESALPGWWFLRALGVVYAAAFLSLWIQLPGLIGSQGIAPAAELLRAAARALGPERFAALPTLAWLGASDAALHAWTALGALAAACLLLDVAPALAALVAWAAYLSLSTGCREFLWFQWDSLLLETGFLALWIAPWRLAPARGEDPPPRRLAVWLLRWLLLRLMLSSGVVKLTSGDPTWRNLSAMEFHYVTQPLANPLSWLMQQLPAALQRLTTVYVFVVELGLPWALLGPARARHFAARSLALFQVLLIATGNYAFFNWLTIALCVPALDGQAWPLRRPRWWTATAPGARTGWPAPVVASVAVLVLTLSLVPVARLAGVRVPGVSTLYALTAPWHLVNSYGLFAVMTTQRHEIILEGSRDGQDWRAYEFRHKPGDVRRPPTFVAPHQPRLDWQMWFAALSRYEDQPWFMGFCRRLLEGSPPVLSLLARNPFPDAPPRYLRAVLYDYRFTGWSGLLREGRWWDRRRLGLYCPALSLRE